MQYEANTPEEYLALLEDDWRKETLSQIRNLIIRLGPELEERIEYKMLAYGDETKTIFHLTAQKAYVSLYVGDIDKIDNSPELLRSFDRGKGCIRIKKSVHLSETRIEEFIARTLNIWREGGETDC